MHKLIVFVVFCVLGFAPGDALADALNHDELQAIVAGREHHDLTSFKGFVRGLATTNSGAFQPAAEAYLNDRPVTDSQADALAQAAGVYTRLRYADDVIAALGEMIALRTDRQSDRPQYENPAIRACGQQIAALAGAFGLEYRNVDDRVFEVDLGGGGGNETLGVLTHCDVVPADAREWVLEDGTRLDPFAMTRKTDRLYGRGSEDDKGSIVSALYVMKVVKETGIPLRRKIRLLVETTEETGGEGFAYYKARNQLPSHNIVLDSRYPAVIAEKGVGRIDAYFPAAEAQGGEAAIVDLGGALAVNTIPMRATMRVKTSEPQNLARRLEAQTPDFVSRHGGDFSINVSVKDGSVEVVVTGKSAHSSRPEEGVNPVPRLARFALSSGVDFGANAYLAALRYIDDLFGLDYLGGRLGVAYRDGFMGPLTISPTYIATLPDRRVDVAANLRAPRGQRSAAQLRDEIARKIDAYAAAHAAGMTSKVTAGDWLYRDPSGPWLRVLLDVFGTTTGREAKPISTAGSTTAKLLPNAINFGPNMPGEPYTAHGANELKKVDNLNLDLQMLTEAFIRLGRLERMD